MSKSTQETLPPQTAIDQIIGLYNEGQLEQTVSLADRGDCLCWVVVPLNSEIPVDPSMLSGKYSKKVNYVSVADEVLIDVQPDYSFHITEHTSSIMAAGQALQDSVNALLNQSHSHP